MTDEQYVLQEKPKATVKWKQSEQPSCYIDDGFGQILGVTPNDFPARSYPEIIRSGLGAGQAKSGACFVRRIIMKGIAMLRKEF